MKLRKDIALAVGIVGIIQICIGVVVVACSAAFDGDSSEMVRPYWAGAPLVIFGSLGIGSWITRQQCLLIVNMIFNIILFIMLLITVGLVAIAMAFFKLATGYDRDNSCYQVVNNCVCNTFNGIKRFYNMDCEYLSTVVTILEVIVAMCVLGAIITLVASVLACVGLCCCKSKENTVAILHNNEVVIAQQSEGGYPPGIISYQQQNQIMYDPPPYTSQPAYPETHMQQQQPQDPTAQVNPAYTIATHK